MLREGCVGSPVLFSGPCAKGSIKLGVWLFLLPDCTERSGLKSPTYFVGEHKWFVQV